MSAWTCRSSDGKAGQKIVPPRPRIPCWKGLGADSEEKHEPVSDIDAVVVDSLKALDPEWPIREDATQPETADAADPSHAAAVEGDRHRERSTRYFTQLWPQGRNGREGEVRGADQGACREPSRLGGTGRTAAHCPASATRTDCHPASPLAGHCPG